MLTAFGRCLDFLVQPSIRAVIWCLVVGSVLNTSTTQPWNISAHVAFIFERVNIVRADGVAIAINRYDTMHPEQGVVPMPPLVVRMQDYFEVPPTFIKGAPFRDPEILQVLIPEEALARILNRVMGGNTQDLHGTNVLVETFSYGWVQIRFTANDIQQSINQDEDSEAEPTPRPSVEMVLVDIVIDAEIGEMQELVEAWEKIPIDLSMFTRLPEAAVDSTMPTQLGIVAQAYVLARSTNEEGMVVLVMDDGTTILVFLPANYWPIPNQWIPDLPGNLT